MVLRLRHLVLINQNRAMGPLDYLSPSATDVNPFASSFAPLTTPTKGRGAKGGS